MKKIFLPLLSAAFISSCMQAADAPPLSEATITQLSGLWIIDNNQGSIRFYNDETVKINMPNHEPAIKLISPYESVKEATLGIALGGFWTGPALVNTSDIAHNTITISFPDETPLRLHKQK